MLHITPTGRIDFYILEFSLHLPVLDLQCLRILAKIDGKEPSTRYNMIARKAYDWKESEATDTDLSPFSPGPREYIVSPSVWKYHLYVYIKHLDIRKFKICSSLKEKSPIVSWSFRYILGIFQLCDHLWCVFQHQKAIL